MSNQPQMAGNLSSQLSYLKGSVKGIDQRKSAQIFASTLTSNAGNNGFTNQTAQNTHIQSPILNLQPSLSPSKLNLNYRNILKIIL